MQWQHTTIYPGSARTITINLRSKSTGRPYDLTGIESVEARFIGKNQVVSISVDDGGVEIVEPAGSGTINLNLSVEFISSLRAGQNMTFDVVVVKDGKPTVVRFKEALTIERALCDC